jgi:hypothetical protein
MQNLTTSRISQNTYSINIRSLKIGRYQQASRAKEVLQFQVV